MGTTEAAARTTSTSAGLLNKSEQAENIMVISDVMVAEIEQDLKKYFPLIFRSAISRQDFHTRLQKALVAMAVDHGMTGQAEYSLVYNEGRRGLVDVVWMRDRQVALAVEVDSSCRQKSLDKLSSLACPSVWVYYGKNDESYLRHNMVFGSKTKLIILSRVSRKTLAER